MGQVNSVDFDHVVEIAIVNLGDVVVGEITGGKGLKLKIMYTQ